MKRKTKKLISFTFEKETIDQLNRLPRAILPNKSKLVESLVKKWLEEKKDYLDPDIDWVDELENI